MSFIDKPPKETEIIPAVSSFELPCYIKLSNNSVKIGGNSFDEIQEVANKINKILKKHTEIEFKFDPTIATWNGNEKLMPGDCKISYDKYRFEFTLCLWQREGDLILDADYYGNHEVFSRFYKKILTEFIMIE